MTTPPEGTPSFQGDPGEQPPHASSRGTSGNSQNHPRALKRTVVRPPTPSGPDGVDSAYVATRLTTLTHELANLLDGSLRVIGLARRSLDTSNSQSGPVCPEILARHLATVTAAMIQMAELVRESSLTVSDSGLLSMRSGFGATSSVSEAIRHAVDVMSPLAEEFTISVDHDIAPGLENVVAGPIFVVVTNALRNSIESIQRNASRASGGEIHVRAWMQPGKTGHCITIEVLDNGEGLGRNSTHTASSSDHLSQSVFSLGFTTKPGNSGIGLSLCRDIVHQLGGTVELRNRPRDPQSGRGGAVLSVCYPVPRLISDRAIAG
jgi:signal transduction histidine kinase